MLQAERLMPGRPLLHAQGAQPQHISSRRQRQRRVCLLTALALICEYLMRQVQAASYCPITVSYEVSLGQAPVTGDASSDSPADFADVPIFFGKIGVFSTNVRALRPTFCLGNHCCEILPACGMTHAHACL